MKKRFFGLVTALAFCLALLPIPTLAAEPEESGPVAVEGQAGTEEPMLFSENSVTYLDENCTVRTCS